MRSCCLHSHRPRHHGPQRYPLQRMLYVAHIDRSPMFGNTIISDPIVGNARYLQPRCGQCSSAVAPFSATPSLATSIFRDPIFRGPIIGDAIVHDKYFTATLYCRQHNRLQHHPLRRPPSAFPLPAIHIIRGAHYPQPHQQRPHPWQRLSLVNPSSPRPTSLPLPPYSPAPMRGGFTKGDDGWVDTLRLCYSSSPT